MSLMIQNCTFLKIPIGTLSRVFRMCQKTNEKTHFLTKNEQKQAHLAAGARGGKYSSEGIYSLTRGRGGGQ